MTATGLSRRELLFGRAASVAPLRPPWALAESAFLEACTRCDACVDACPERVLARDAAGRPRFDPQLGECSFCGACAEACVPGALRRSAASAPWTLRALVSERCLGDQGVVCRSCEEACPELAVLRPRGRHGGVAVDADRCSGCGACIGVCPAGALRLQAATETAR
ncbi:ferredoxin-type protein NapF [Lysobacter sp. BMK333-48F3]|uniref:ferredoxin-type protein NapF n=1 Tax=Lysobacter sp. BMK333-48F3 TaxID=2867962 RepID=UPI001C8C9E76|nr:ferredoxin-type protein NapF [Lysobacter sp. BMK333-48F3]MBX9402617.1 ferredoxin-type protein NapF [Lysobacter sp. BMK333-48F3]